MSREFLSPLVLQQFNEIKKLLNDNFINPKELMSAAETCRYLNISYSKLTKLTANFLIPFHKPTNGVLFFFKEELHEWVRCHKVYSNEDAENLLKIHLKTKKA